MVPQNESITGRDTLYQFGDHHDDAISPLLALYTLPSAYLNATQPYALSFGLSGCGTGVPFHTHGAVFAEVLHGAKRWFVSRQQPPFDGTASSLHWYRTVLPTLNASSAVLTTVCYPGDLLYLPASWWHSTLNIGDTVFMSVFV